MTEAVAGALRESDISAAGQTLASAFQDDPLQIHVFPNAEERAQRSPAQFSALVRAGYLFGKVFVTPGMMGVSIWMPPGHATTPEQAAASGFRELPHAMGNEAFTKFAMVLDYLSDVHGKAAPTDHWYLIAVGVHPNQQRRGHGYAVLRPILARSSAEGIPICLETAQPKVRAFYEKLGFKSVIESVHPDHGLRFWTYQRDR